MQRTFLRRLAGATAGLLLTGTSTFAADLGVAPLAPPPPPIFTWTGFELGVQVGGGVGRTSVNIDGSFAPPFAVGPSSDSYSTTGPFGGIHLGFNYQLTQPIVVGVQVEGNFAGITGNVVAPPINFASTSIREVLWPTPASESPSTACSLRDWRLCLCRHPQRNTISGPSAWGYRLLRRQPLWFRCRRRPRI